MVITILSMDVSIVEDTLRYKPESSQLEHWQLQLISVGGDRMGLMWCPEMDERTGDGDIGSLHVDTWSDEE